MLSPLLGLVPLVDDVSRYVSILVYFTHMWRVEYVHFVDSPLPFIIDHHHASLQAVSLHHNLPSYHSLFFLMPAFIAHVLIFLILITHSGSRFSSRG